MASISESKYRELSEGITPTLAMLDALYHRNKNQHRYSAWWRSLELLRRAMRKLIEEESTTLQPQRVSWLAEVILPKVYLSFTQLAADKQFAQLGIALIAMLATVHTHLKPWLPEPQESASIGIDPVAGASVLPPTVSLLSTIGDDGEEMGEVIARPVKKSKSRKGTTDSDGVLEETTVTSFDDIFGDSSVDIPERKKKKKKTAVSLEDMDDMESHGKPKQVQTIDDIFGVSPEKPKTKNRSTHDISDEDDNVIAFDDIFGNPEKPKNVKATSKSEIVDFNDIFGKPSKPKKKRPTDETEGSSSKKQKSKTKDKETFGFDDIFGSSVKKTKKKKTA